MKTSLVILVYFQFDYLKNFLENFFNSRLVDEFDIWVIENYSEHSDNLISPYLKKMLSEKKIFKYILFKENIANSALQIVSEHFSEALFRGKFSVFSDADIDFKPDPSHLECLSILNRHPELDFCSLKLDFSNLPTKRFKLTSSWFPKYNSSCCHYKGHGGIHFSHFRNENLLLYLENAKKTGQPFLDSSINQFLVKHGISPCITRINSAVHLTWDDYNHKTEYLDKKLNMASNTWTTFKKSSFEVFDS